MPDPPDTEHGPLNPEHESLFGLTSDEWQVRLQQAHQSRPLGPFGSYELLAEIGRGSQGEVYRAVQPGTGRVVALKRIAGLGFAPDPVLLDRFTREVEALTRLSHPNVVTVHALDVVNGHTILVMELVEGRPIDQWADLQWARTPEPLQALLAVFARVCAGVAHAHQRGVIHRDIKPSNILVSAADQPKVLDFGIARLLGEHAAINARPTFTVTGFAGTPAYASPEQLVPGGGIDTRSDVYSLGILLYRMLAGCEAFSGPIGETARRKTDGPAPGPRRIRRNLPSECDWIVQKATDPSPCVRYQTVDALADDVSRLIDGRPILAHPPSWLYSTRRAIRRRPLTALGVGVSLVAVTSLVGVVAVQAARLSVRSSQLAEALNVATRQRDKAEQEERLQRRLKDQLIAAVSGTLSVPGFMSFEYEPRIFVNMLGRLVGQLSPEDSDETALTLHTHYGYALRFLGRFEESAEQLTKAHEIVSRLDPPGSARNSQITVQLSIVLRRLGRDQVALSLIQDAINRAKMADEVDSLRFLHWAQLHATHPRGIANAEFIDQATSLMQMPDLVGNPYVNCRIREDAASMASERGLHTHAEKWARDALDLSRAGATTIRVRGRLAYRVAFELAVQGNWEEAARFADEAVNCRVTLESAASNVAHSTIWLHAECLHRLRRFDDAARQWTLALLAPSATATPDPRRLAPIRIRLAAAQFANGRIHAARTELAKALSGEATDRPDDPGVAPLVSRVEEALVQNAWQVSPSLDGVLGELAWMTCLPNWLALPPDLPIDDDERSRQRLQPLPPLPPPE